MLELQVGTFSNAEIAEWLQVSDKQFSKRKATLITKLQPYCEYEAFRGGVKIIKVFNPFYVKDKKYQIIKEDVKKMWDASGLDSCSRIADEICNIRSEEEIGKPTTVYDKTRAVRNELYGKPMSGVPGTDGTCSYVWCKKLPNGRLAHLSEEEQEIKTKLLKKYFSTADEKTAMVQTMIENGELSKEEAWQYYSKIINLPANYSNFMHDFKTQTGIQLVRGTQRELLAGAWEDKKDE